MSVHSGAFCAINGKGSVAQWSTTDTMTPNVVKASNTLGGTARRNGVSAWTGSFKQFLDAPQVMPGEEFTFTGFTAPEDDVSTDGGTVSGTVIVDSVAVSWNWETGAPISIVTNFSGDLAITYSTDAPIIDETTLEAPSICGVLIKYIKVTGTAQADTTLDNITQATLTITAANQSYVNSSTACNTGRKKGDLDWTLALTEQNTVEHADVKKGADLAFKIYTTASRFWLLSTGKVEGYSNFTVDRESQAIVSRQINISMNASPDDDVNLPAIKLPGAGSNFWPSE